MAWRAAATGNDGGTTNTATCAITVPGTAVAGDVAVAFLEINLAAGATFTPPASDGWTLRAGPNNTGTNVLTALYTKTLVSGDVGAVKTFTCSAAGRFLGVMEVLSGVAESSIVIPAFTSDNTAGTTIPMPSVTTTAASSDVLQFLALRNGTNTTASTITTPTGFTLDGSAATGAVNPSFSAIGLHLTTPGAAGSYGGETVTTAQSVTGSTYTVAFAPPTSTSVALAANATPVNVSTTLTTASITVPTGAAAGHLAVLVFHGGDVFTNTAPAGWTKQTTQSKTGISLDIWTKTLVAGDLGSTVTVTSNNTVNYKRILELFVFSGAQLGQINSTLETAAGTAHLTPNVSAIDPGAWVLAGVADRASPGSQAWTLPAALTSQAQAFGSGGGAVSAVAATATPGAAGAVGQYTVTGTVSTVTATMYAVVIEPSAATVANSVNAGADITSEPRVALTRTATATGTPTGWAWTASPALTLTGATTATVGFTTPPNIAQVTYTLTATASYASGGPAVNSFHVIVYPVTRRFFAIGGGEVPLRMERFT